MAGYAGTRFAKARCAGWPRPAEPALAAHAPPSRRRRPSARSAALERFCDQVVAAGAHDLDVEKMPRTDDLGIGVGQVHLRVDVGRLTL